VVYARPLQQAAAQRAEGPVLTAFRYCLTHDKKYDSFDLSVLFSVTPD